jgi:hypothetical protein
VFSFPASRLINLLDSSANSSTASRPFFYIFHLSSIGRLCGLPPSISDTELNLFPIVFRNFPLGFWERTQVGDYVLGYCGKLELILVYLGLYQVVSFISQAFAKAFPGNSAKYHLNDWGRKECPDRLKGKAVLQRTCTVESHTVCQDGLEGRVWQENFLIQSPS